ncbi:unnamed protein product [Symbiodinium sp. CCMP2592]|nr:unnamed protein product [Symbiodinium sp. CCMP2592]
MEILEDPWSDRVGVREAIHRLPAEGRSAATHNSYQPYVGLQEWENIKASVAHEVIPTRRFHMSDYKVPEEESHSEAVASGLEGVQPAVPQDMATGPAAGLGRCQSGKRSPRDASASPKVDALQRWLVAKEQALQFPSLPIAIPNHSPRQRPTKAVGRLICASATSPREGQEQSLEVQVNTVNPTNLAPKRRDGPVRAPQIRDKDREKYPSGKLMRPVRKANADSWQKLTEVLDSPGRINAKESHPSRAFNVVPKTNLRVV